MDYKWETYSAHVNVESSVTDEHRKSALASYFSYGSIYDWFGDGT